MDNLVFSNMLHRPARTVVSVLGIAIGVLLIVFTIGMANGTMRERAEREGNVGAEIIFSGSGSSILSADSLLLPVAEKDAISQVEGVEQEPVRRPYPLELDGLRVVVELAGGDDPRRQIAAKSRLRARSGSYSKPRRFSS